MLPLHGAAFLSARYDARNASVGSLEFDPIARQHHEIWILFWIFFHKINQYHPKSSKIQITGLSSLSNGNFGPQLVWGCHHLRLGLSHEGLIDADQSGYATGLTGAAFRGWIKAGLWLKIGN